MMTKINHVITYGLKEMQTVDREASKIAKKIEKSVTRFNKLLKNSNDTLEITGFDANDTRRSIHVKMIENGTEKAESFARTRGYSESEQKNVSYTPSEIIKIIKSFIVQNT